MAVNNYRFCALRIEKAGVSSLMSSPSTKNRLLEMTRELEQIKLKIITYLNSMADEGEPQYQLLNLATNQLGNSSRDFTGRGRAMYLNGDIYEGDFVEGVFCQVTRCEPDRALTITRRVAISTKAGF